MSQRHEAAGAEEMASPPQGEGSLVRGEQDAARTALLSLNEARVRELREGAGRLPKHVAQKHGAVILRADEDQNFTVGLINPGNVVAMNEVAKHLRTNSRRLLTEQVSAAEFNSLIHVAYGTEKKAESGSGVTTWKVINQAALEGLGDEDVELEEFEAAPERDMDMRDQARLIMRDAYRYGASDMHFRPGRDTGVVLFRKDGLLEPRIPDIPKGEMKALATTLMSMARVPPHKAARSPMDSKIRIKVVDTNGERKVAEYRAGFLPDINGVKITLRLNVDVHDDLDDLGFEPEQLALIAEALLSPEGMILITGPTGGGKSNTLQAILKILRASGYKEIVELADPVEFNVDGSTKINITGDCTWVQGIKHVLRNDPDVVSLSELRWVEETLAAFNAALTGHLVPTTLHATNVGDCLTRLMKYGLEPHLLSRGLILIMTQRLVRKLCSCKVPDREIPIDDSGRLYMVYKAVGCEKCNFRGYNGRTAFGEVMKITPTVRDAIVSENMTAADVVNVAVNADGMLPMQHAAGRKLAAGVTSFLEVERVMRLEAAGESAEAEERAAYRTEYSGYGHEAEAA